MTSMIRQVGDSGIHFNTQATQTLRCVRSHLIRPTGRRRMTVSAKCDKPDQAPKPQGPNNHKRDRSGFPVVANVGQNINDVRKNLADWVVFQLLGQMLFGRMPLLVKFDRWRESRRTFYIDGKITDASTGLPLSGAYVGRRDAPLVKHLTGSDGGFSQFRCPPHEGKIGLVVSKEGYLPLETCVDVMDAGKGIKLDLALTPEPGRHA